MGKIKLSPRMKKVRDNIVYVVARFALLVVRIMPHFMVHFFAKIGGYSIWFFSPFTRKVMLANLSIAFPNQSYYKLREIAIGSLYSLCMTTMESFWFSGKPKRIQKYVSISPEMHAITQECHDSGKGAIYMVSHLGNWEMAGIAYPQIIGGHISAVARTFNNSAIDRLMTHLRTANGNEVIKADEAAKGMLKAIRQGKCVPTLIDQNTSIVDGGVFIDFFGLPVPVSRAPAKFAIKLQCHVILINLIRKKGGKLEYECEKFTKFSDDEVELTQNLLDALRKPLMKYPDQYLWFYKRFRYIPRDIPQKFHKYFPFYARVTGDYFYPPNHRRKEGDESQITNMYARMVEKPSLRRHFKNWIRPKRDCIVGWLAMFGIFVLKNSPHRFVKILAQFGAICMWYCCPCIRKIIRSNLTIALPERKAEHDHIGKASLFSLCMTSLEAFWFSGNLNRIEKYVILTDDVREMMESVVAENKGVIYTTAHFGNWEMAALAYTHYYPGGFASIARTFNNHKIDNLVCRMRTCNGNTIVKSDLAAKGILHQIRAKKIIATLNDQNTPIVEGGVFVDFFGLPVPTSRGPAKFALKMQCPIMNVSLIRQPDDTYRYLTQRIDYEGLDEIDLTQKILKVNEENFVKYPEQYLWFYKRFLYIPQNISEVKKQKFPFYATPALQNFYGHVFHERKDIGAKYVNTNN